MSRGIIDMKDDMANNWSGPVIRDMVDRLVEEDHL